MLIYLWLNKNKERFYRIIVKKNEHSVELDHHWGSCNTNRGGKKNISLSSEHDALDFINKMIKRRKSRGYELIIPENESFSYM